MKSISKKHSPQQIDSASLVELIPDQEMNRLFKELQSLGTKSLSSNPKKRRTETSKSSNRESLMNEMPEEPIQQ